MTKDPRSCALRHLRAFKPTWEADSVHEYIRCGRITASDKSSFDVPFVPLLKPWAKKPVLLVGSGREAARLEDLDTAEVVVIGLNRLIDLYDVDIWIHTHPANDVGGDLVDYLPVGEGRLGLSLGDVAGKGLGAALFMAKLQATLRALAPGRESIPALGAKLSGIFDRDGLPNRFTSLVYLEIASDSGEIRFLNAGHMPPLHLTAAGITELPRGGAALGILKQATFTEQFC